MNKNGLSIETEETDGIKICSESIELAVEILEESEVNSNKCDPEEGADATYVQPTEASGTRKPFETSQGYFQILLNPELGPDDKTSRISQEGN